MSAEVTGKLRCTEYFRNPLSGPGTCLKAEALKVVATALPQQTISVSSSFVCAQYAYSPFGGQGACVKFLEVFQKGMGVTKRDLCIIKASNKNLLFVFRF